MTLHFTNKYPIVASDTEIAAINPRKVVWTRQCNAYVSSGGGDLTEKVFRINDLGYVDWEGNGRVSVPDADLETEFQCNGFVNVPADVEYQWQAGTTPRIIHAFMHPTKCAMGSFRWDGVSSEVRFLTTVPWSGTYFACTGTSQQFVTTVLVADTESDAGGTIIIARVYNRNGVLLTLSNANITSFFLA